MSSDTDRASSRNRSKKYYQRHRAKILSSKRVKQRSLRNKLRNENPEKLKSQIRKRTLKMYGITPEQFQNLLEQQGGVCRICHQVERSKQALSVDHDHSIGTVRGLLCSACNKGLGFFRDSITRLSSAQRYLIETGGGSDGR